MNPISRKKRLKIKRRFNRWIKVHTALPTGQRADQFKAVPWMREPMENIINDDVTRITLDRPRRLNFENAEREISITGDWPIDVSRVRTVIVNGVRFKVHRTRKEK